MKRVLRHRQLYLTAFLLVAAGAGASTASAAFHLWYIQEAYSNPSGSVQFIELFTNDLDQEFTSGVTLTSNSHTFTFPSNAPSPTAKHTLLFATAGFGSIPGGATPDFTIPSNFFNPTSDTLTYAGGVDVKPLTNLPSDGIKSISFTDAFSAGTVGTNSPRNYAGAGSSVNLSTPEPGTAL
jgi:serralysin